MEGKGKRTLPLLLVVVMLFAIALSACSKNNSESVSPSPLASAVGTSSPMVEHKLSMLGRQNDSWPYSKDWPIWKYVKEKTGVTLDVIIPPGDWEEAVNLAVASNSMPDIMFGSSTKVAQNLGEQGALVNLLDHLDQMPNFKAWLGNHPTLASGDNLTKDGKMYLTPNEGAGLGSSMIWMYRKDIFDENGLQPPTTWDELEKVLLALKLKYPDSYPMSNRNFLNLFDVLGNGFGDGFASNWITFDEGKGVWHFGPTDPNYKTMVEYMNRFHQEKLIPPDSFSLNTKQWQELMSTNKGFVTFDYIGRIDFYNTPMRKDNPKFDMEFMAPPAGTNGKQVLGKLGTLLDGLMVSSKTKQLDAVLAYIDWLYSEDGKNTVSWGKEGETYKVVDGKKQFIQQYASLADMTKATGFGSDGSYLWYDYDAQLSLMSPELKNAYTELSKFASAPGTVSAKFTNEQLDTISTVGDPMDTYREENIARMVLSKDGLKDWDKYVEGMNKLGVDEIMQVFKDATYDPSKK